MMQKQVTGDRLLYASKLFLISCTIVLHLLVGTANPEFNFWGLELCFALTTFAWCCLQSGSELPKHLSRNETKLLAGLFGLLLLLAFRAFYESGAITHPCLSMPGWFLKAECLIQRPYSSGSAPRQIIMHFTALLMFYSTAIVSRENAKARPLLGFWLALPAIVFAFVSALKAHELGSVIPSNETLVINNIGANRGGIYIGNSSWLWPLLVPAFSISLASLVALPARFKAVGALSTAIVFAAIMSSQQRGGYALIGVSAALLAFISLARSGWPLKFRMGIALACSFILATVAFNFALLTNVLQSFFAKIGFPLRAAPFSVSNERLDMWKNALPSIRENWFNGHGVGSWIAAFSKTTERKNLIFDTAHNLWVQSAFELGIPHTLLIFSYFGILVFYTLKYKNASSKFLRTANLLFFAGSVMATFVQELDYIPATYTYFAIFSGYFFGGESKAPTTDQDANLEKFNLNQNWGSGFRTFLLKSRNRVFCVASLLALVIWYLNGVSFGGFAFEPVSHPAFLFNRWYHAGGVLTASPDRQLKQFSFFPISDEDSKKAIKNTLWATSDGVVVSEDSIFLKNGSKAFPNRFLFQDQTPTNQNNLRMVSFALPFPPLQLNHSLFNANGMSEWEVTPLALNADREAKRWCQKKCTFEIELAPQINSLFRLQLPLIQTPETRSQSCLVSATQRGSSLPAQSWNWKATADSNNTLALQITLETNLEPIFKVSISCAKSFSPHQLDSKSLDNRQLGILVSID